jgi:cystathionine beta-lyase/cystathionine gamma-synthase
MDQYIKDVLKNMPSDWLRLTTHRLDIYNESLAKTQFLEQFEKLFAENNSETSALIELPTAFDYIRLGHPLSCLYEWTIAKAQSIDANAVISFSSSTVPILAVLRKNLFAKKNTQICFKGEMPKAFDADTVRKIYNYQFDLVQVQGQNEIKDFDGSTIYLTNDINLLEIKMNDKVDFYINLQAGLGSVLLLNGSENTNYISEIQHVRRRETIAMTPANCLDALKMLIGEDSSEAKSHGGANKATVIKSINEVCGTDTNALISSSGLSIQYAILMGLVDNAVQNHAGKAIKIVVPPNCYGGTNDQARRVAACLENVEVVDLPVDGDHDMVQSIDLVLNQIAAQDAVPYIIAEIPTNPRVEVPELNKLRDVLSQERKTTSGETAVDPVFILDQTFCPNVHFLGDNDILSKVRTISFASGSKFPSGGKCTAGYCLGNKKAESLVEIIGKHLKMCDNEATELQVEILAKQMPSMIQRIAGAYKNTREFVSFIEQNLPDAKINFVSKELAEQGFTPSVFSLDLPTKGNSDEEREAYKRKLNLKLINMMITEIPDESKYCVSYGQLKGCYWTIPATSTQGTTKEGDKDYIARVALSADMDLEKHKEVFSKFVEGI